MIPNAFTEELGYKTLCSRVFILLSSPLLYAQNAEALTPWQEPSLQLPGNTSPPPSPGTVDVTQRNGAAAQFIAHCGLWA